MVVDTGEWCRRRVGARARQFLATHPRTRLLDQDALNVALADEWVELPLRWNAPAGDLRAAPVWGVFEAISPALRESATRWDEARADPAVLHFVGYPKPWQPSYPWPDLRQLHRRFAPSPYGPGWPPADTGPARHRRYRRV